MTFRNDPDGRRLPVKLDTTSNGEYAPVPLEPVHHEARQVAMEAATTNAKRLGLKRRELLVSACGAATALLGMNAAYARAGRTGGWFDVPKLAALEPESARAVVEGDEFIFDVQGHFVNPTGAWLKRLPEGARPLRGFTTDPRCEPHRGPGDLDYLRCVGPDQFVKDVFLDSDTDLMVLSFVPSVAPRASRSRSRRRRPPRASSSSSRARTACTSTGASTRTRPVTSNAWTCSRRSTRCRRGRPTRSGARTRRASGWTTSPASP